MDGMDERMCMCYNRELVCLIFSSLFSLFIVLFYVYVSVYVCLFQDFIVFLSFHFLFYFIFVMCDVIHSFEKKQHDTTRCRVNKKTRHAEQNKAARTRTRTRIHIIQYT